MLDNSYFQLQNVYIVGNSMMNESLTTYNQLTIVSVVLCKNKLMSNLKTCKVNIVICL